MGYYKKRGRPTKAQQEERSRWVAVRQKEFENLTGFLSAMTNITPIVTNDKGDARIRYVPRILQEGF